MQKLKLQAKGRLAAASVKVLSATQKEAIKFIKETGAKCGLKPKVTADSEDDTIINVIVQDALGNDLDMILELQKFENKSKPVISLDLDRFGDYSGGLFNDEPRIYSLTKDGLRDVRRWQKQAEHDINETLDLLSEQKEWVKQFTRFIEYLSEAAVENGSLAREPG